MFLMQCWYCGCDIPYELIEKIKSNQSNVCCESCCAILSRQDSLIEDQNFKRGLNLKEIHRQWIFIISRQVYVLLRNSKYTNMIREKKELKNHQINRLTKKLRLVSLEQDIPNKWLDNPNINRKDFMDYNEYRQRQLCTDEIFEASFLSLFQNSIKFVYNSIVGNNKIDDSHGKIQMEIIDDLMKHYGVSINYYERGTFLYYITIFISRYIYDLIKKSKQNPTQNEDLIEKITKKVLFEVSSREANNELLTLIVSNNRKRFKNKYELFQSDLIWNQIYRKSFLIYVRWLTDTILELMSDNIDFSNLQGIKRDLVDNLTQTNFLGRHSEFPLEFIANLMIVLSRMIYTIVASQANKLDLKLHQIEFKTNAINEIVEILKSGILKNEQINTEYLVKKKNNKSHLETFNEFYQDFRTELKSDKIFAAIFENNLRQLIIIVSNLITGKLENGKISNFESFLINTLQNFQNGFLPTSNNSTVENKYPGLNMLNMSENEDINDDLDCTEDQLNRKPVWYSKLKEIITEMINQYGPNFLEKVAQKKITWKDIQKKYSKRKIRDRIVNECNLKTLDATKTMSPWFEPIFLEIFGENPNISYNEIILDLWASPQRIDEKRRKEVLPKIQNLLFHELDLYKRFFPDYQCSSISRLSEMFKINPNAMAGYLQEILKNWLSIRLKLKLGSITFQKKYEEIWNFNWQEFQAKIITYDVVKKFIETRGGTLITTSFQWNRMEEYPSNRNIKIRCSKGHTFSLIVTSLLNKRSWCYECRELKCESIACMFMDKIFDIKFIRQANLGEIFNLPKRYSKEVICDIKRSFRHRVIITRQTFDCYAVVRIQGTNIYGEILEVMIKLALEYDGIQHDKYVKNLHRGKIENYYKQRCRDIAKEGTACENNTIIIRIKESKGYYLSTLNDFHTEIVRQFQKLTGIKLSPMRQLIYDIRHNCIKTTKKVIDIPLEYN